MSGGKKMITLVPDYTQWHTHTHPHKHTHSQGSFPLDEWSARCRDPLPDNTQHTQQTHIHAQKGNALRVGKFRTGYGRTVHFTLRPLSSRIFSGDKEIVDSVAFVHSPFLKGYRWIWGYSMSGENCLPVLAVGLSYQIALIWVFSERDSTFQ